MESKTNQEALQDTAITLKKPSKEKQAIAEFAKTNPEMMAAILKEILNKEK